MHYADPDATLPGLFSDVCSESNRTPNHALQRIAPGRHAGCFHRRLSTTVQPARQPPQSLSLGSLGD